MGPNWRSAMPYSYSPVILMPNLGAPSLKPLASAWPKSFFSVMRATFFFFRVSPISLAPARPCTSPMVEARNM